jgi:polyribonucleotide nucleotidyltransferase
MQAIVAESESQTTETVDVPTDKHRKLIGRGGDIKKDLENKFKVLINVPRQGTGETGVKISGLPADVEKAKAHILGLVKDQDEGVTVQVPRRLHHSVADNGAFFKKLRNDHQVIVDHGGHRVPPKSEAPPARANGDSLPLITDDENTDAHSWNVVGLSTSDIDGEIPWILRGRPENLPKAKDALTAAIVEASKNDTVGYLVLANPHNHKYVVGQAGSKVISIRKATGCKITVPRNQESEAIEIVGTAEGVQKAKDLVLQAVKEGKSNENGRGRAANGNGNGNRNWV